MEVRDGIARHSTGRAGCRSARIRSTGPHGAEGQVARVADIIAYVNHDIDDSVRAGILHEADLPKAHVEVLGRSSSERIGRMVTDVVVQTLEGGHRKSG